MNTAIKDYLKFAKDVLGIKHLFFSTQQRPQQKHQDAGITHRLIIVVDNLTTYAPDEKELLLKMIGALKMDPESYEIITAEQAANKSAEFTLLLVDTPGEASATTVATFSPRHLLKFPDLKKRAWADMQFLLKKMN